MAHASGCATPCGSVRSASTRMLPTFPYVAYGQHIPDQCIRGGPTRTLRASTGISSVLTTSNEAFTFVNDVHKIIVRVAGNRRSSEYIECGEPV